MKIVIIGGVAAGTKTAAKLKRELPNAEVVIYTKGSNISYAGCGLPYYIGGAIESRDELIVNTPAKFSALTGAVVHTGCEVTRVNPGEKTVEVTKIGENGSEAITYDKLVIATGATPILLPGSETEGVFAVRTPDDAIGARNFIEKAAVKRAVVVGGGFIGLEVAENLVAHGINVTVVDAASQLMPNIFDPEMADYIRRKLLAKGIRVNTGTKITSISAENGKVSGVMTSIGAIPCEMVIMSVGIRPASAFLDGSGIELERGLVVVDEHQKTNLEDIYAVGDCAIVKNRLTGGMQWSAMGSTANITGRALALHLTKENDENTGYKGCLGTGVVKLSDDLSAARTGLTEKQAIDAGYDVATVVSVNDDKAHYYPGSSFFVTKLIADKATGKLLGMQVIGAGAVDKMTDIAVVGLSMGAKISDFVQMDFAYAPPFSTAIHPFAACCSILVNKLEGRFNTITPVDYIAGKAKSYTLIDAHPNTTLPGAEWADVTKPEEFAKIHSTDEKLLLVCARGKRGYLLQTKLRALGFTNTAVLEGGATFNVIKKDVPVGGKLSADEIKRVKGLGCLIDKRYGDVFNVRVITRNGKITTEEHRAVAEGADKFGSGEVTMTTRLTLEIQGVPYANIDPLIEFLNSHGIDTGGTGSLVRPVVSCKGTTCQYGLIDTFALSEKLHELFYKGYHTVTLPHKFKIAVGGCPNNCVKPDLNDLGIVGQRVPVFDFGKCRGCAKCQVELGCPIKIAKVENKMLAVDTDACNGCGRCKGKCPFGVTEEYVNGYKIYIGGRWGKKIANGQPLHKLFTTEEEVITAVENAILLFRDEGISGERFADTVARLGFDYVEDKIINSTINKEEVIKKQVKGGATC